MSIFSDGCSTGTIFLRSARTRARVKPPALPPSIMRMRMYFDMGLRSGVSDMLEPTVPIAEEVSKRAALRDTPSMAQIAQEATITTET